MERIDDIDARILELLQANGRMKRSRIAEDVGLSVPTVSDRMRKLEERGVLIGFARNSAQNACTSTLRHSSGCASTARTTTRAFVDAVTKMAEVQELHSVTGDGSHILKIRTKNTTTLEALLSRLQALPGVHGTTTSIVLSSQKETTTLPVEAMTL